MYSIHETCQELFVLSRRKIYTRFKSYFTYYFWIPLPFLYGNGHFAAKKSPMGYFCSTQCNKNIDWVLYKPFYFQTLQTLAHKMIHEFKSNMKVNFSLFQKAKWTYLMKMSVSLQLSDIVQKQFCLTHGYLGLKGA